MEKYGIVQPGLTPDVEDRLPKGKVAADKEEQIELLDDDLTKRLADRAAGKTRDA